MALAQSDMQPGKYDTLCTMVREYVIADGVIVIVFNGRQGSGFSCQATPELTLHLPELLRDVADKIQAKLEASV